MNAEYLLDTDIFNVVKVCDTLNVRSSLWINMDDDFNYFAGISSYLPFDKGLQNI